MFKIINKQILSPEAKRLDIEAPEIARKIRPGQFVIVTSDERAERIPFSVFDSDSRKGTITLVVQETGQSSKRLTDIPIGGEIFSILGPLGKPARIEKFGVVVCVATGFGVAQILPVCRSLKEKGNKVIGVIGAKTKKALVLEAQMRINCSKVYITTNDGSYERRGLATDFVKQLLEKEKVDLIYAIGSVEMMQGVSKIAGEKNIPVLVNLNPVMLDGTGMCGSCRVKVNGEQLLACVDGPEFNGREVDFEDLHVRMNAFKEISGWDNPQSQSSPSRNETRIFTKFLSGILKK